MGKALEILFEKYYRVEKNEENLENFETQDLLERRGDEKSAMESIYGESFTETIKNRIWHVKLNLPFLSENGAEKIVEKKEIRSAKNVCRLFQNGKCRFAQKCKFLHISPEQRNENFEKLGPPLDFFYTLEIRFPTGIFCPVHFSNFLCFGI